MRQLSLQPSQGPLIGASQQGSWHWSGSSSFKDKEAHCACILKQLLAYLCVCVCVFSFMIYCACGMMNNTCANKQVSSCHGYNVTVDRCFTINVSTHTEPHIRTEVLSYWLAVSEKCSAAECRATSPLGPPALLQSTI